MTGRNTTIRVVVCLSSCFLLAHVLCAWSNAFTTQKYVNLALRDRPEQYARPLYDSFFETMNPGVPEICLTHLELLSDVSLWIIGARFIFIAIAHGGESIERTATAFAFHSVFMSLVQVSTTLPSSGGIDECLHYNELDDDGILQWPAYGVSFLTQSFAGGRACADMLYSGHTAVCLILTFGIHLDGPANRTAISLALSVVLVSLAVAPLVYCHGHYMCDVTLSLGIAPLLCTSSVTQACADAIRHTLGGDERARTKAKAS